MSTQIEETVTQTIVGGDHCYPADGLSMREAGRWQSLEFYSPGESQAA